MFMNKVAIVKSILLFFFMIGLSINYVHSQNRVLDVGARFQKTINLYLENGITAEYSDHWLFTKRLYLGCSYVSSRLGTALGSNALKQDNFLLSTSWYARPERLLRPLARANIGYFIADYEADIFKDLPNNSMLFSVEGGMGIDLKSPMKIVISLGYNLITGNGEKGPGTVYPVYLQTSATWDVFNKK
jgi:hypothetical protein